MTHGFFRSMGGFYEESTNKIITLEMLMENRGLRVELASTRELILDKSKADVFAKIVTILQLSWFITQCVTRANQHLTVTLLEAMALAFAVSSIIASLLWFYKPLNVRYHIPVPSATGSLSTQINLSPTTDPRPRPPLPLLFVLDFLMQKFVILLGGGGTGKENFEYGVPQFGEGGPSMFSIFGHQQFCL